MSKSLAYFRYLLPRQVQTWLSQALQLLVIIACLILSHPYFSNGEGAALAPFYQMAALAFLFHLSKKKKNLKGACFWSFSYFVMYAVFLRWIGSSPYLIPWGILGQYLAAAFLALAVGLWWRFSTFVLDIEKFSHRLASCLLWGLIEWSRQYWFCGFPWYSLSFSWIDCTLGTTLLGLLGPFFTSSLILLTAMELSLFFKNLSLKRFFTLGLSWILCVALGKGTSQEYQLPIQVAALHTDMPLHYFPGCYARLAVWEKLLEKMPPWKQGPWVGPRFCLTHEGLLPGGLGREGDSLSSRALASKVAKFWGAYLLMGLEDDGLDLGVANAIGIWNPLGESKGYYHKKILVPFAEYFPLMSWPLIGPWLIDISRSYGILEPIRAGTVSGRYALEGVEVLLSICFEETFASSIAQEVRSGAQLWMSSSNDGWFPDSVLPFDHFLHARLVSASTGLPLVRSTQKGYSAIVNGWGEPVGSVAGPEISWEWKVESGLLGRRTLYGRTDERLLLVLASFFVSMMAFSPWISILRRKGTRS